MTHAQQMAGFVHRASYDALSPEAREQLKIRVLDSIGCALGAMDAEPIRLIAAHTRDFGGAELCTLFGGGRTAPDRAAFFNGALVRYLDFSDSYLAKDETCHPSDNVAPVLAAAEYANQDGREFLTALAVAYQVQCRLSDVAPVRAKGFDHTTQGSYAVAAGVCRALGLNENQTANALAISGTAFNALRVTRTGALSHWKGLAYPNTAFSCAHAAFLAMRGITGPIEVFEGNKGFMEAITGRFEIDWQREDLERVSGTILKKYNAEIHSQTSIDGMIELKREHAFSGADIDGIELETFDVAYRIIGGGEEGDKVTVRTKEDADHSLPYLLAVAALDGQVLPEQYSPERVQREDVQALLRRVVVRPDEGLSRRFPAEMPCRLSVRLRNGKLLSKQKSDYQGFHTQPMSWDTAMRKFTRLSERCMAPDLPDQIAESIARLDAIPVADLLHLLAQVRLQPQ
jgi:2-methylcitrate dehydratase